MPGEEDKQQAQKRHRLLVNPEELGLTGRIKKALLEQELGLTQKIQKAMSQTRDKNSNWYIGTNFWVTLLVMLVLMLILGYGSFRNREISLVMVHPNKETVSTKVSVPFFHNSPDAVDIPAYARVISFKRVDLYGKELSEKDFHLTDSKGNRVKDPHHLFPGLYNFHVDKEGYQEGPLPIRVGDVAEEISVELTPVPEPRRRVQVFVNDPLRPGELIEPDDIRLKENNKSVKDVAIKAGRYVVIIEKAGYHPKESIINVQESGRSADTITLDYKARAVKFFAKNGPSEKGEDPEIPEKDILLSQEGKSIEFKNQLLQPGRYILEVHSDGYAPLKNHEIVVSAGSGVLDFRVPLEVLDREVRVQPNYDLLPSDLKIDKAYLKDIKDPTASIIPITTGVKVSPKKYLVKAEKTNYKDFQQEIFIAPGSAPFIIRPQMLAITKSMLLKILSDFDPDPIVTPAEFHLDMRLAKPGYQTIEWGRHKQSLPAEKREIEVAVFMETIPRRVVPEITSDIAGSTFPDLMSFTPIIGGKPGPSQEIKEGGGVFKPGMYHVVIKKTGFEDIEEDVIIYPSEQPFVLRREIKAKHRPVIIEVDTDYDPGKAAKLDAILVNREPREGDIKLKPGNYTLLLRKRGFHEIEKDLKIIAGTDAIVIKEQLKAKERRLIFDIIGGVGGELGRVNPDVVTFDNNEVLNNTKIPPKKGYNVRIKKKGYADWAQSVVVEPSEDPMELRVVLNTLMRRILLSIVSTFPPGKDLTPADTCTLELTKGSNAPIHIVHNIEVKPGNYKLSVVKAAFQPVNREENITPDEAPYEIKVTMVPKQRPVVTDITYQVQAQTKVTPTIKLESEDGSIKKELRNEAEDKLEPNRYNLEIVAAGYKKISEKVVIDPSETVQFLKYTLAAEPRPLVINVVADYPTNQNIRPDRLLVDGLQANLDAARPMVQIQPGIHSILIEKVGYQSLSEGSIFIPAGVGNYEINKQLFAQSRVVTYSLNPIDEPGKDLTPDTITLNNTPVNQSKDFKPNRYQLKIELEGYHSIVRDLEIPIGEGTFHFAERMTPANRLVTHEIISQYDLQKITPQEITLNGKDVNGRNAFAPSGYDLVIYNPGYERVVDKVFIAPSRENLVIRRNLNPKPRKVVFNITGTFPQDVKLKPDKLTFNDRDMQENQELKPSPTYQVIIEKEGYMPFSKTVAVEPSEESFVLTANLKTRPRRLEFKIDSTYRPGVPLDTDNISFNSKKYNKGEPIDPGVYHVELYKAGYEKVDFQERIEPGLTPYTITKTFTPLPRHVEVHVTTDWLDTEIPQPEVLKLSDRDITPEEVFHPRQNYELLIQQRGYQTMRSEVEVPPGDGTFIMEKKLLSKDRVLKSEVTFDVPPPNYLGQHVIRIRAADTNSTLVFQENNEFKPGRYYISVDKDAYEPIIDQSLTLVPDETPYVMKLQLQAKTVEIQFKISYDIPPLDPAAAPTVTFIDEKSGIGQNITHGKRTRPSTYLLEIAQPGYIHKTPRKRMTVLPSTQPFIIEETLYAKERAISFDLIYENIQVRPTQILLDGTNVKATDTFLPGKKYQIVARFKDYRTVKKDILMPPGEGPYVADVRTELAKLEKFSFRISKRYVDTSGTTTIDGMRVGLEIYTDGVQVEPQQIELEGGSSRMTDGSFYAAKESLNVRVFVGFYYDESVMKPLLSFSELNKIEMTRLIEHLRDLAKINVTQSLRRVDALVKEKQDRRKLAPNEGPLIQFLRELDLVTPGERELRTTLIRELQEKVDK